MIKYRDTIIMKLALVLAVLISNIAFGQTIGRVGTTAAPFLKIGVGGRALGMGEASTSIANDVTAMFWNPAGTTGLNKMQAIINHFDYIADLTFDYAGIAIPIEGFGTIGAFAGKLGMPDIERTTIYAPDGNGEKVSAGSTVVGLNYSRSLTDHFSIGGNFKYITESIWHSGASAVAGDVGILYRTNFKNVTIGMSISNFGTNMQMNGRDLLIQHDIDGSFAGNNEKINADLKTDEFPLPILFRVGLSANIAKDFLGIEDHDWTIAVDAIHPNDNKEYMNVGTEIKLFNMIALRGGYRNLLLADSEGGLTLGFGIQATLMDIDLKVDYANIDYGRLDHQNKFSLILSF